MLMRHKNCKPTGSSVSNPSLGWTQMCTVARRNHAPLLGFCAVKARSLRLIPFSNVVPFSAVMAVWAPSESKKLIMPVPLLVPSGLSCAYAPPAAIAPNGEKILNKSLLLVSCGSPETWTVFSSLFHLPPGRRPEDINILTQESMLAEFIAMPLLAPVDQPPLPPPGEYPWYGFGRTSDSIGLGEGPKPPPPPPPKPPLGLPFEGGLKRTLIGFSSPSGMFSSNAVTKYCASSTELSSRMAELNPAFPAPLPREILHHFTVPYAPKISFNRSSVRSAGSSETMTWSFGSASMVDGCTFRRDDARCGLSY